MKQEQILEAKLEKAISHWKSFDDADADTDECEKARQICLSLTKELHDGKMKSVKERLEPLILEHGYVEEDYGYKKETPISDGVDGECVLVHWISLYEKSLQMYAYLETDGESEDEKEYDTGMISANETELVTIINVLTRLKT